MWQIGNVKIKNQVVMAPMAGISDPSYIRICSSMGLAYAITELISSEAIIRGNKKTFDMLNGISDINIPIAVQIFGSNPDVMANASKILIDKYNIKIIDINMGCPVPKVAIGAEAGSSLLKNPDKVYSIVKKVVDTIDIPVTVKIRSGWDSNTINAVEIAKIIEKAGASAIAIHPRTRAQGYSGLSDWNIIKEVKANVSIPVIGNGDITTPELAKKMLLETKCDAIMIGRALMGNPWLIKKTIDYLKTGEYQDEVSLEQKSSIIKKHYEYLVKDKGEKLALLEFRTHVMWYLKGLPNSATIKKDICSSTDSQKLMSIIDKYFDTLKKGI